MLFNLKSAVELTTKRISALEIKLIFTIFSANVLNPYVEYKNRKNRFEIECNKPLQSNSTADFRLNRVQPLWCTITLIGCLWLTGCSTLSANASVRSASSPAPIEATQARTVATGYLHDAQQYESPEREEKQLQAANMLIAADLATEAQPILQHIDLNTLPPDLAFHRHLLQAKIALAMQHPRVALTQLTDFSAQMSDMPTPLIVTYYRVLADAYQQVGDRIRSIQARVALSDVLTDPNEVAENNQAIWALLQTLSTNAIAELIQTSNDIDVEGWGTLALLLNQQDSDPQTLLLAVQDWEANHPDHPANGLLPSLQRREQVALPLPTSVQQIALLLPLSGELASSGDAIRNGFLTTYYAAEQRPRIKLYDTASPAEQTEQQDVVSVYQRALEDGADVVVGPLTKSNVQALSQSKVIAVPTIALNTLNDDTTSSLFPWSNTLPAKLYQFGLSPQDEATQVAHKAWQQGKRHALVVVPASSWGKGVAGAFQQTWIAQGGDVVQIVSYDKQSELSDQIQSALRVSDSNTRQRALSRLLSEKIKTIPRRRQDVDMIFMAADPQIARQLLPLFKFHYAGDIPVYGTSRIYSGRRDLHADKDLNGVLFCDIPLLLAKQYQQRRGKLQTLWGDNYQQRARLYALGSDAYTLTTQLNRLALSPHLSIEANTGRLSLTADRHIYRSLTWAHIEHGDAVQLAMAPH